MATKYKINEVPLDDEPVERTVSTGLNSEIQDDNDMTSEYKCCQFFLNTKDNSSTSDSLKMHKVIKILVIGPGNSGKSTILKQMNIIHGKSYPEKERTKFKYYVIINIFDSIIRLVNAMRNVFNLKFEREYVNEKNFNLILEAHQYLEITRDLQGWQQNLREYKESILSIWRDSSVRIAYQNRNKFYFNDSTDYFIQHIDRISKVNYIPEIDDLLRVRQPTTGILEYTFKLKGAYFMFLDVGGQRSERRKWINCFENVTSMLFVTSLSDYDLTMSPDELKTSNSSNQGEINRMKDSLDLFYTIVNWKKIEYRKKSHKSDKDVFTQKTASEETLLFKDVSIILFLNKQDLFEKKFQHSSIKYWFEDYDERNSLEQSKNFIAQKFISRAKGRKDIYWHYTCALDKKNIEAVIAVVRDSILNIMTLNLQIE